MNAQQFLTAFTHAVATLRPTGYGAEWTQGMYRVFKDVGEAAGFVVNQKGLNGEINLLDVAYFPRISDPATPNWHPPAVIIEHENAYNADETRKDFWKACLYVVPLRVIIGYQRDEARANQAGQALCQFYQQWQLRQLADGETLLIMGWNQVSTPYRWHAWSLRGTATQWSTLQVS
jgi:hypothetical protein